MVRSQAAEGIKVEDFKHLVNRLEQLRVWESGEEACASRIEGVEEGFMHDV